MKPLGVPSLCEGKALRSLGLQTGTRLLRVAPAQRGRIIAARLKRTRLLLMRQRIGFAAVTGFRRWVLSSLVGSTLLIGPLAIAGPPTNARWHPEETFAFTAGLGQVVYQQNDTQDDDNEARVREGSRVRRGHLPFTDAAVPLWLSPLIVSSALVLIGLGVALIVTVRNAEDERYLLTASRLGGKRVSDVPSRASTASHGLEPASRTETKPNVIERQLGPDDEKTTSSDLRSVAKAWGVIGRGSIRRW
jgi:hypothetical protein